MFADIACPFEAHFRASVSEMSREKLGRRMRRDDLATVQAELLVLVHHGVPQRIMLATRCTAPRIGPKSQLLTEKNGFPISRQVYPSLMFSIHTASTGPSKTNHLRSFGTPETLRNGLDVLSLVPREVPKEHRHDSINPLSRDLLEAAVEVPRRDGLGVQARLARTFHNMFHKGRLVDHATWMHAAVLCHLAQRALQGVQGSRLATEGHAHQHHAVPTTRQRTQNASSLTK